MVVVVGGDGAVGCIEIVVVVAVIVIVVAIGNAVVACWILWLETDFWLSCVGCCIVSGRRG